MDMDKLVALCKRRGFIFQSSEIYGGINGFWDYGPLGVELKKNIKDAWWHDMVRNPPPGPDGQEIEMVGVDCAIIMNPKVWEASGHASGFADPMVSCAKCRKLFRADKVFFGYLRMAPGTNPAGTLAVEADDSKEAQVALEELYQRLVKKKKLKGEILHGIRPATDFHPEDAWHPCPMPDCDGSLMEPRAFNLMFETHSGALKDDASKTYLRPETAQGIFVNFKNVLDSTRLKLPFGI